jgi:hypothetical protein
MVYFDQYSGVNIHLHYSGCTTCQVPVGTGLPILSENWVDPSNSRTVNRQATDCVPLARVELQTVLEPFTADSCNAAARFELLPTYNTPNPILCKK